jgi:aminopeptidase YwaD
MFKKTPAIRIIFTVIISFWVSIISAQNLVYAKKIVDTLCSQSMYGRGYYNKGDIIASDFLKDEFLKLKLDSFPSGYFQYFPVDVNIITGEVVLKIGKKTLAPGVDFLTDVSSPTSKGEAKTYLIDSTFLTVKENADKLTKTNFEKKVIIIDKKGINDKEIINLLWSLSKTNYLNAKAFVYINDKKLTWGVSTGKFVGPCPVFEVSRSSLPKKISSAKYKVKSFIVPGYETRNVIGYIKGKEQPDSFIVFTAHYDHLGMMGDKTMFPGANDNASGVAMSLDLMKYYASPENKPYYSIVFIATAAEELGILGSKYFCANPLFEMEKIKFLINLDMVSTGDDGIMVVNGAVFTDEYDRLVKINTEKNYIKSISKRGEAKNSDHWFFYKNKVKCFFIYTMGGISEYHNIYDKAETLPYTEYNDLFKLLTDFVKTFN